MNRLSCEMTKKVISLLQKGRRMRRIENKMRRYVQCWRLSAQKIHFLGVFLILSLSKGSACQQEEPTASWFFLPLLHFLVSEWGNLLVNKNIHVLKDLLPFVLLTEDNRKYYCVTEVQPPRYNNPDVVWNSCSWTQQRLLESRVRFRSDLPHKIPLVMVQRILPSCELKNHFIHDPRITLLHPPPPSR